MNVKFYICRHCGNLVGMIHDAGVPMMCCGQKMETLEPNTVEASGEKHLPAIDYRYHQRLQRENPHGPDRDGVVYAGALSGGIRLRAAPDGGFEGTHGG